MTFHYGVVGIIVADVGLAVAPPFQTLQFELEQDETVVGVLAVNDLVIRT